jgi:hypothetical protein
MRPGGRWSGDFVSNRSRSAPLSIEQLPRGSKHHRGSGRRRRFRFTEKPLNNRCFLLGCALIAKAIAEGVDEETTTTYNRFSYLMDEVSDMLNIQLDSREDYLPETKP